MWPRTYLAAAYHFRESLNGRVLQQKIISESRHFFALSPLGSEFEGSGGGKARVEPTGQSLPFGSLWSAVYAGFMIEQGSCPFLWS